MEEKKLKVLIVHNYYKQPGGEGFVVENEKNMLEDNGHRVFLYSRNNNEIDKYSIIQKFVLPINYLFNIKTYFDIKRIIKREDIDIIHIHNTINIISKSVYYSAIKCKVPIVQTVHNFRFLCPNGLLYRNNTICEDCINNNLNCAIKNKCYRNSFLETTLSVINMKQIRSGSLLKQINFICLTEFNKEKLLELNRICKRKIVEEGNIYIKPNFVSSYKFNKNNKRENYYVYASRLDENKGIKFLLDVWKNIKNLTLFVCGSGNLEKWCKKYIDDNHINNVVLKGNVEHNELVYLLSKSKALIYPTRLYEGMPLSIIEAYSTGTPVLATNIGNVSKMIIDGKTGYKYKYDNKNDFIEKLLKINESDLYGSTYDEFLNKYTDKKNYEELMNIYSEIISKSYHI